MKKKYFITLAGGLGNQMLQYSLYLYLKSQGYSSVLYHKLQSLDQHNGLELNTIFPDLNIPFYHKKRLDNYSSVYKFLKKINNFLAAKYKVGILGKMIKSLPYQILDFPTWNDYTFVEKIHPLVCNAFKFPALEQQNKKIADTILKVNSVSIHVRRGDYVENIQWRKVLGDICDLNYYLEAIEYIKSITSTPLFVIFSDDMDWVRQNFNIKDAVYVDWNKGNFNYVDMQLMSMCKHNIIANSTFSLMGAWLNTNPGKQVVCPSKWRNYHRDTTCELYIPKNWKIINNTRPNISLVLHQPVSANEISNILAQSYTDFELILHDDNKELLVDERISLKSKSSARGNFIFNIGNAEIQHFSDRNLVNNMLEKKLNELK